MDDIELEDWSWDLADRFALLEIHCLELIDIMTLLEYIFHVVLTDFQSMICIHWLTLFQEVVEYVICDSN